MDDTTRVWWVQAEGITAFIDRYQRTEDRTYLDAAGSIWDYVEATMINKKLEGLVLCRD